MPNVHVFGKEVVITAHGYIGVEEAAAIRETLFPLLNTGILHITFRLGMVDDIDSSGLGLLLATQKKAKPFGIEVRFEQVGLHLLGRFEQVGIVI